MPRTWHVQADSASDNKCKYLFAFFAHCVGVGAATDVEVYFLMVGHTHEDIDALFSVIADKLRQSDGTARAVTTDDLKHIIEDAFTQEKMSERASVEVLNGTWDWKAFYAAFLDPEFAHFRDFFAFRLQGNPRVACGVSLLYKPWSIDRAWLPEDPRGVQVMIEPMWLSQPSLEY